MTVLVEMGPKISMKLSVEYYLEAAFDHRKAEVTRLLSSFDTRLCRKFGNALSRRQPRRPSKEHRDDAPAILSASKGLPAGLGEPRGPS